MSGYSVRIFAQLRGNLRMEGRVMLAGSRCGGCFTRLQERRMKEYYFSKLKAKDWKRNKTWCGIGTSCDRRFGGCDADWSYAACEWNVIDGWIL